MILLVVGIAHALDAHGPAALPAQADAGAWTWNPLVLRPGEGTAGVIAEGSSAPLEERLTDERGTTTRTLLGPFVGATAGVHAGLLRWAVPGGALGVGLHAALPAWWEQDTDSSSLARSGGLPDAGGGGALGDARLDLPITYAYAGDWRLAATLAPAVSLGTASRSRLFGESGAPRLRGRVAASIERGRLGLGVDVTRRAGADVLLRTAETGDGVRMSAALRAQVASRVRASAEVTRFSTPAGLGMEALGGAAVDLGEAGSVALAGGRALGAAPGTSAARGYLRWTRTFGKAPPPPGVAGPVEPPAPVVDTRPAGRFDATLQVRDPAGAPLDATITLTAPEGLALETLDGAIRAGLLSRPVGADGFEVLRLAPGRWSAMVSLPGSTSVRFAVDVAPDAPGPASLIAVLHPVRGDASLAVRVHDAQGAPVAGAELLLDDRVHATTSTGGAVDVEGLARKPTRVQASAPGLPPTTEVTAALEAGHAEVDLLLTAPPESIRVRTRDAEGLAVDAQVLALGPEVRGPIAIGPSGSRIFPLTAGTWTVAASSPLHGLQEREVTISPDDRRLPLVDVVFPPLPVGEGEICVRTVDPAGAPVAGLNLRLDGAHVGRTTTGGTACIAGLLVGDHEVSLESPRIRPVPPQRVTMGAGTRELLVPVQWRPGELDVHARTSGGLPIDAELSFRGATSLPSLQLGPDGWSSVQLPMGEWTVILSAPSFGVQERAIFVEPGATHLLEVEARMAREEGAGALLLEVFDPAGAAVENADVRIDGVARGSTSNGGALRVGGLSLGRHRVQITASRLADIDESVDVNGSDARLKLATSWRPGTVRLRARGPQGPAPDAMVLLTGPDRRGPLGMDAHGELLTHVTPGSWGAYASSPRIGEGERSFDAPAKAPPPIVEVVLAAYAAPAPTAPADLLVVVRDTDDRPVPAASVEVQDRKARSGADGAAILEGLPVGVSELVVRAEGYTSPPAERLSLHAGPQPRTVRLRALPRAVDVRVRGPAGPIDATLLAQGRVPVPAVSTGADGREQLSLLPGSWSIAARAEGVGADVKELRVPAGVVPLTVELALGAARVTVQQQEISLGAPIRFAFAEARILPASNSLLREIAAQLLLHPEFARVALNGHTDDVGLPEANLLLSRRRAEAVRDRLVALGVPAPRLSAEGFGATRPLAPNTTEEGRQQNRRVEFLVTEQAP